MEGERLTGRKREREREREREVERKREKYNNTEVKEASSLNLL